MRVEGVSWFHPQYVYTPSSPAASGGAPVMSKDDMLKLLDLLMYNQSGMAFKLARIASQMYAGMNLDFQA